MFVGSLIYNSLVKCLLTSAITYNTLASLMGCGVSKSDCSCLGFRAEASLVSSEGIRHTRTPP